jgi:hypothetical protein
MRQASKQKFGLLKCPGGLPIRQKPESCLVSPPPPAPSGRPTSLSLAFLVLANFLPLFGTLFLDWSVLDIVALYWAENLILGGFAFLRILTAQGGHPHWIKHTANVALAAFFAVHYGLFCFVHGMFVFTLLGQGQNALQVFRGNLLWALLALVISHGLGFWNEYLRPGTWKEASARREMSAPYARIVLLHLAILFGAFAIQSLGSPVWMLAFLVIGKTGLDLILYRFSQRKALAATAKST